MTNKTLVEELRDALQAASDHLDYVGYGDSWERECAREAKLEEQIAAALKRAAMEANLVTVPPTMAGPDTYATPPGKYLASIGAKGGKKKGVTKKRGDAKHYRDMANSRWDKPK